MSFLHCLNTRFIKALAFALCFFTSSQSNSSDSFPDAEKTYSALSLCALNVNLSVDAGIKGSLKSLFQDASAKGGFSVETTTSFLELFPEADKLKAYRAYRLCMFKILGLSKDSICTGEIISPYTRIALSSFKVGPGVTQEDLYSTSLASFLRMSRKYELVFSESVQQALEQISNSDSLISVAMANDTTECAHQADQAFLPSVSVLGDKVVVTVKIVDIRTSKILRILKVQGSEKTVDSFNKLISFTWRQIEEGLAPESWVWRHGVGYCEQLKSIISDAGSASCKEGSADTFSLMGDERTGNSFIDNCQQTWRRNQMEPVCMFQCVASTPTNVYLYKRLNAYSVIDQRRSSSEQRAFVEKLKKNYGYTEQELAKFNIREIYPDKELKDPETIFTSATRDIHECLSSWKMGSVTSDSPEGNGSKSVTFSNGKQILQLELHRVLNGDTLWNSITLNIR